MLTSLIIKATIKEEKKPPRTLTWQYSALEMLVFLQQALPGVLSEEYNDEFKTVSIGAGSDVSPYRPNCSKHWFYIAKMKGRTRFPITARGFAWISVGGRMIAIDPSNLYSSDWGTDGVAKVLDDPTYPTLRRKVEEWKTASLSNTDALLCDMFYQVAKGGRVLNMPDFLPVLINVLLVSEVARNHTAFHTNLMATDLIRAGAAMPTATGTIPWTWENAIWIVDSCPDCGATGGLQCGDCAGHRRVYVGPCGSCRGSGEYRAGTACRNCGGTGRIGRGRNCGSCRGSGWFRPPTRCNTCAGTGDNIRDCGTCRATGAVQCRRCKGKGRGTVWDEFRPKGYSGTTISGGGEALQNGLLPMSHMGSAFGSAFRLTNDQDGGIEQYYTTIKGGQDKLSKAPSTLTVTRRKEASVLIQWLALILVQAPDANFDYEEESESTVESTGESGETVSKTVKTKSTKTVKVTLEPSIGTTDIDTTGIDFATVYDEVEALAMDDSFGTRKDTDAMDAQVKAAARSWILKIIQMRVDMISNLLS